MRRALPPSAARIQPFSSPILWKSPPTRRAIFVNSPRPCARRRSPPPPSLPGPGSPRLPLLSSVSVSVAGAPLGPSRSPPSVLFRCPQARVFVAGGTTDPMACGGRARARAALAVALAVVLCSLSTSPVSSSPEEEEFVRKTVSAHEIVVFSKSYCPYCKRAKAVFKELGKVPYVVELDQREDGSDVQDALIEVVGRRTVPQVFINGKHIGGSDDTVEAYQTGALAKLLGIEPKDDL